MRLISRLDSDLAVDTRRRGGVPGAPPRRLAALLRDDYQLEDEPLRADGLDRLNGLG